MNEVTNLKKPMKEDPEIRKKREQKRCEGWDSGQKVRCANSRFLLNFETKTDLKLFATHDK